MAKSFRVQRRDRTWIGSRQIIVVGPFAMPPLGTIQAAVERIVEENSRTRIDWELDVDRKRWTSRPLPPSVVIEGDSTLGLPVDDMLAQLANDPSVRFPVGFVRYPQHLAMVVDHAVSDGRGCCAIVEAVAAAAITGHYTPITAEQTTRYPLLQAVARTFGRHPSKIRDAIADRPAPDPTCPGDHRIPWRPSPTTITATIDPSVRRELVARERTQGAKATPFAILAVAALRALRAAGITVSSDVGVTMDLRMYVDLTPVEGNFVHAGRLRLTPSSTATEMSSMIWATMQSGRPLANEAVETLRPAWRPRPAKPPTLMNPDRPIEVTFTDVGMRKPLPYLEGRSPDYFVRLPPAGPHAVTIGFIHTQTATLVSASFHDNVVDEGRMRDALAGLSCPGHHAAAIDRRSLGPGSVGGERPSAR